MPDIFPNHEKAQRGFTLIETVLALLVITVGIMSSLGLLGSIFNTTIESHEDLNIVSFADMVFNQSRAVGFNSIPTSGTIHIPDYGQGTANVQIGSIAQLTCAAKGFSGNLKEIYTVSYRLDVRKDGNIKTLDLHVWPGYDTSGNPRRFHTEIYNWRKR